MQEHVNDPYVKLAKQAGYRSRATFKLAEIDARDKLLKQGHKVVDLGSAPGGWSQYATQRIGPRGTVIALDLLDMVSLPGVTFIQDDFRSQAVLARMSALLPEGADLVMSDMAPNMSGVGMTDQARVIQLGEDAFAFAQQFLKPGGSFLVKTFHGQGYEAFVASLKPHFGSIAVRKPKASRDRSSEVYLLAKQYVTDEMELAEDDCDKMG